MAHGLHLAAESALGGAAPDGHRWRASIIDGTAGTVPMHCFGVETVYRDVALQAAIWKENDLICVRLRSRKNRQGGSGVMKRACTCPGNPKICPVHWLWEKVLAHVSPGTQPWGGSSADAERKCIREVARQLAV